MITPAQAIISSGLASCTCSLQVPSPNFFACSPTQLLEGSFETCRSHPFTLLLNTVQQRPRVLSGKSKFLTRTYDWLLRGLPQPTAEPSGLYIQSLATNLLSATGICQTPTLSELLHYPPSPSRTFFKALGEQIDCLPCSFLCLHFSHSARYVPLNIANE